MTEAGESLIRLPGHCGCPDVPEEGRTGWPEDS